MKNLRVRYKILKASIRLEELKFDLEDKFSKEDLDIILKFNIDRRMNKLKNI